MTRDFSLRCYENAELSLFYICFHFVKLVDGGSLFFFFFFFYFFVEIRTTNNRERLRDARGIAQRGQRIGRANQTRKEDEGNEINIFPTTTTSTTTTTKRKKMAGGCVRHLVSCGIISNRSGPKTERKTKEKKKLFMLLYIYFLFGGQIYFTVM